MKQGDHSTISTPDFVWALGSACALHQRPFDAQLLLKQCVPPYNEASLVQAARDLGFKVQAKAVAASKLTSLPLPFTVFVRVPPALAADALSTAVVTDIPDAPALSVALIVKIEEGQVTYFPSGSNEAKTVPLDVFMHPSAASPMHYTGRVLQMRP